MGGLFMKKWVEKKNWNNTYTYIVFDDVLSDRYKVTAWCFSAQAGDKVTYKAQQIGDQIWLSVLVRSVAPCLLKRIPCGTEHLSNDAIYKIAVEHI